MLSSNLRSPTFAAPYNCNSLCKTASAFHRQFSYHYRDGLPFPFRFPPHPKPQTPCRTTPVLPTLKPLAPLRLRADDPYHLSVLHANRRPFVIIFSDAVTAHLWTFADGATRARNLKRWSWYPTLAGFARYRWTASRRWRKPIALAQAFPLLLIMHLPSYFGSECCKKDPSTATLNSPNALYRFRPNASSVLGDDGMPLKKPSADKSPMLSIKRSQYAIGKADRRGSTLAREGRKWFGRLLPCASVGTVGPILGSGDV
ncbi:hypothetical protein NMY22_g8297 [Coprinellus aureogranulatus]|nr:hypothetical protein NMY22_g8297 [Coprinellus aureogranulatus]